MSKSTGSITLEPLHEMFGARLHGLNLSRPLSEAHMAQVKEAFETHSVLVFSGQTLSIAEQVRFSEAFGPLEKAVTRQAKSGPGLHVALLSNVDPRGGLIAPEDRGQLFNAANRFWHTDSTFKPEPALASLLYAIQVPPSGGETEFVSTRAAYDALPAQCQERVRGLWAVHDFQRSRDMVGPDLVEPHVQKMLPPVPRPLLRVNPSNGRASLYIASHADYIEGMGPEESRALLDRLLEHCTRPQCVYTHAWTPGDLVMWDNRATMHRGCPWRADLHPRVMTRTTVIDRGYDDEPGIRAA